MEEVQPQSGLRFAVLGQQIGGGGGGEGGGGGGGRDQGKEGGKHVAPNRNGSDTSSYACKPHKPHTHLIDDQLIWTRLPQNIRVTTMGLTVISVRA